MKRTPRPESDVRAPKGVRVTLNLKIDTESDAECRLIVHGDVGCVRPSPCISIISIISINVSELDRRRKVPSLSRLAT